MSNPDKLSRTELHYADADGSIEQLGILIAAGSDVAISEQIAK